ncbi:VOC family protein [Marinovum sp. 2_MG-2023]|uniref:VOC family protein n=1 Tax=unclassified Marinovum TaxID=2647166 RepID=UPI0026E30FEE|nr:MULTISPECIES: VOC family protein [unclassified Marinovum]MDO6730392.1 VOC family protein [Marinovum sp. 2_MG-2023]MDO6778372.1 VOC family protein [Marinovum sp. 1_MG-2023]
MSRHICLVALVVPDYDAAIAFYVDAVGFDLLEDSDLGGGKRWVRIAPKGAQTAILLARAVDDQQQAAVGNQTGGRVGFFLQTDDFAADHTRMTRAGVTFEEPPRDESYGRVAVWRDPFGNRWDLIQFT